MSQKTAIAGLALAVVLAVGGAVGAVTADDRKPVERSRSVEERTYTSVVAALNDEAARRAATERVQQNLGDCASETFTEVLVDKGQYVVGDQVGAEHLTHESCEGLSPATVATAIDEMGVNVLCILADMYTQQEGGEGWGVTQAACVPAAEALLWERSRELAPPPERPPGHVWCPAGEGSWMSPEKIDAGGCD